MNDLRQYIRYLSLLAPVPEGYAVFLATDMLGWNVIVRGVAAVIVAGTGFWGVQVMNDMAEYNATLKKAEENEFGRLPTWKAMIILAVWFSGVTLLTVFLDVNPTLQKLTPLGLVVIGFSAAFLFNLSNLHATRTQEIKAHRQDIAMQKKEDANERKNTRKEQKERRQEIATKKKEIGKRMQDKGIVSREKGGAKLSEAMLLLEWSQDPTLTCDQMAKKLMNDGTVTSVTRQAIDGRLKSMIKKGLVIRKADGQVFEVLFEAQDQAAEAV